MFTSSLKSTVLSSHLNFVECESKVATVFFLFCFCFLHGALLLLCKWSLLSLKCHLIQQTLITSAGLSRQAMSTIVLPVGCLNLITFVFIPFLLCVSCGYYSTRRSPILCLWSILFSSPGLILKKYKKQHLCAPELLSTLFACPILKTLFFSFDFCWILSMDIRLSFFFYASVFVRFWESKIHSLS